MTTTELQEVQSERFIITPTLLQQVDHLADMMSNGGVAVPDHLRGKKGACFALVMQALQAADSVDLLDVAADLIRAVPEQGQRDELVEFYVDKRRKLERNQS
jgi:hypothetical protein